MSGLNRWLENYPDTYTQEPAKPAKPVQTEVLKVLTVRAKRLSDEISNSEPLANEQLLHYYREVHARIAAQYQAGALLWIRNNQPELRSRIKRAEAEWERLWQELVNGDSTAIDTYVGSLYDWEQLLKQGCDLFKERHMAEE